MATITPEPQIMPSENQSSCPQINTQPQRWAGEGTIHTDPGTDCIKNLIIEELNEYPLEILEEMVFQMLDEIEIKMTEWDYKMVRLGRWNPSKKRPRPIKVELATEHKKNKIFGRRDDLQQTQDYFNVRINVDEPRNVRIVKAMLRPAAKKTRMEGKVLKQNTYSNEIEAVPTSFGVRVSHYIVKDWEMEIGMDCYK